MADRKKPAVAFWTTVVVVLVGYPLSFGPACWISSRINKGKSDLVPVAYRPMTWSMSRSETIANALKGYAQLGSASGWAWVERQDDGWYWIGPYF